jgi:polysaccharide biosynthesis transport protein
MGDQKTTDLRWLLAIIWRWLWLIVLCVSFGLGGALFFHHVSTPIYHASTTLLIQSAMSDFQAIMTSERLTRTYSRLLQEQTVLETVIEELPLDETPTTLARRVKVDVIADTQLIRVGVEHPDPAMAAQIANGLANAFVKRVDSLQTERHSESLTIIKQQIDGLTAQMNTTQSRIDILAKRTSGDSADLAQLEGLQAQHRNTLAAFIQGYEQMRLGAAQSLQTVIVVEPARIPYEPTQNLFLYMSLTGLVGAIMGLGAAFLIEYLDDTIKTAKDVSRTLGLKTLGLIETVPKDQRNAIVATDPYSPHGEAFRVLGASICFTETELPLRSILVTSSLSTEGKSFVAANLAAAIAHSGQSVVLIEGDLRRPTLRYFEGLDGQSQGLSAAIEQGELNGLLQHTSIEGLSILHSGEVPSNPSRLLSSPNLSDLLNSLTHKGHVLVIDSPPVLPVVDAMLLARHVDGVLLVVRAGQTRWQNARQAMEKLRQVGAHVTGAVLNGVPTHQVSYYGRYDYYMTPSPKHDHKRHGQVRSRISMFIKTGTFRLLGLLPNRESEPSSPVATHKATARRLHPLTRGRSRADHDNPN